MNEYQEFLNRIAARAIADESYATLDDYNSDLGVYICEFDDQIRNNDTKNGLEQYLEGQDLADMKKYVQMFACVVK